MKLKYLNLVFENLESVQIDGRYIVDFYCDDIKTKICRTAVNSIDEIKVCNNFHFSVKKEANKDFENLVNEVNGDIFTRLCYNDITSISFKLANDLTGEKKQYKMYVKYKEGIHDTNELQESFVSKNGNLYVEIAKEKKFIKRVREKEEEHDNLIKNI